MEYNDVVISNDLSVFRFEKNKTLKDRLDLVNIISKYLPKNIVETMNYILKAYPTFITDPASAKYHGSYDGGLFDHSMAVFEAALTISPAFGENIEVDPIACIFHDLCKCGKYIPVKDPKPYASKYVYDDDPISIGIEHGSESLRRILLLDNTLFTHAWQMAISYHMGPFDKSEYEAINYSKSCEAYPEVLLLHTADMIASKIYKL